MCECCGSTIGIESHHIHTRGGLMLRWDKLNGICLCKLHHTSSSEFSAHLTPDKFEEWLRVKKGDEFVDDLNFKSKQILKLHEFEKKELLKEIRDEIRELKAA